MSITLNSVARVSSPSAETRSPSGGTNSSSDTGTDAARAHPGTLSWDAEIYNATNQPVPPRFPWLSRLSSQLEPVAKQKPSFPSAPPLGENLDSAA